MLRFLLPAVLAAAIAGVTAGGALAHGARLPDAEIFATNNTAVFGGSVTLDGRLVLIAGLEDLDLVKRFVTDIGGDFEAATVRSGQREFVG